MRQQISAFGATALKVLALDKMFSTYILKSTIKEWYYVGHSSNVHTRLKIHNAGKNRSTKAYKPFELVYIEEFETKSEAFKREQQIKKYKHGEAFKKLIGIRGCRVV